MVANPSNPNSISDSDSGEIDGGPNGDIDVTLDSTIGYPATDENAELNVNLTATDISETINIALVIDTSGSTSQDSGTDFTGDGDEESILQAQLFAAENLFQAWIDAGYTADEVNITIIDYSSGASDRGTYNLSEKDDFLAELSDMNDEGPQGSTNYEAALEAVDTAWAGDGVTSDDSNLVIFMSDGSPYPGGQDFDTPARALETDYDANIQALGLLEGANLGSLDTVATSGAAVEITSGAQLLDVVIEPLIPVDFQGFEIYIEGELAEYIELPDSRIILTPAGWSLDCHDLTQYSQYDLMPGEVLDVQVTAIFGEDPNTQSITNDLSI
ncbi:MAG: vWA domain-containing protein, partial [Hyphomicrobiales bacterium]